MSGRSIHFLIQLTLLCSFLEKYNKSETKKNLCFHYDREQNNISYANKRHLAGLNEM